MSKNKMTNMSGKSEAAVFSSDKPAFLSGRESTGRGMEDVTAADVIIPRIELVQALSPARDKKDPLYIEGADEGMMYNSVTRQLYGKDVLVVPVVYRKQYLVWKDRKLGGGTNGFRGAFATEIDAKRHIAELGEVGLDTVETAQHFCLAITPGSIEEVVVSMSKTKLKVSRRWNSLMRMGGGDSFERMYKLSASVETNARNEKYYNFNVTAVGYVTQEVFQKAEALYNQVQAGQAVVSQDYDRASGASVDAGGEEF